MGVAEIYVLISVLFLPRFRWMQQNSGRMHPFIALSCLYWIWAALGGCIPPLDGVTVATIALAIWMVASMIWTDSVSSLFELLGWLSCLTLFLAARTVRLEIVLLSVTSLCAIFAALQFYNGHLAHEKSENMRLPIFGNRCHNSSFLLLGFFCGLWLAEEYGSFAMLMVSLMIGIAIIETHSRGAVVALAAGLMVIAAMKGPVWFIGTTLFLGLVALCLAFSGQRFFESRLGERPTLYLAAFYMIRKRIFTGWGLNMYKKLLPETYERLFRIPFVYKAGGGVSHRVHNDHLEVIVELGVIGYALFVLLFAQISYNAFLMGFLAAVMVNAMFFFPFREVHTAAAFWAVMGAAASHGEPASLVMVKSVLVAVLLVIVVHVGIKMAGMAYYCAYGYPDNDWQKRHDYLQRAIDCDPYNTEFLDCMAYLCKDRLPEKTIEMQIREIATHDGSMRIDCMWESFAATLYNAKGRQFVNWAMRKSRQYKPERKA